jgi:Na+-transporting NADH:ubiquinone oxidoreductase subunit NqrF
LKRNSQAVKRIKMPTLHVTTANGESQTVEASTGASMMEALSAMGLVEGTCGGAASCGCDGDGATDGGFDA